MKERKPNRGRQRGARSDLGLGLGADAVQHRVRKARLHRLYRGVYAVGHTVLTREGRWMAAALACGDGAVLTHRDAATLWEAARHRSLAPVRGGADPAGRLLQEPLVVAHHH